MIKEWQWSISVNNDESAFQSLYLHLAPSLIRFANSFLKQHKALSEDIVAEIFAGLWERRQTLMSIEHLRVYLFTCVRNAALNHLEKMERTSFYSFDELEVVLSPLIADHDPEKNLFAGETMQAIQEAMDALPAKCRLIFRMAKEEGLRYKEIAAILNISVRTIDSQIAIALRKIHETLASRSKKYS
ncbi:RNA polymerase sigma-70 factor [Chitinophaga niabensis]|uniref:RNA polymerase sigma-70 factor, ECF subfamily n=1 Tax=Chitinophaga niabensis TaxID=536979 RepID=A0A1N6FHZ8_9BACT|nr:RNA polymerase sigma-70 factor [Chitinophaga niabensis]SIN94918.1 RNA polymerase sigma-70 factor, ECF subfamily [Chitinophaga niabensis]